MTGPSGAKDMLAGIFWPDATLVSICADYDAVTLVIREARGNRLRVTCDGHIGFELIGFWDETIVERVDLDTHGQFLTRCLESIERRHGVSPPVSGSATRNGLEAFQLVVTLIDGAQLSVAAKGIRTEAIGD